jgi:hypothetical protein
MDLKPVNPKSAESMAGVAMSRLKAAKKPAPVAGFVEFEAPRPSFVTGYLPVAERSVPVVSTRLSGRDRVDGWLVRWDIGRMSYAVGPGLYAVGSPGPESVVLVSANYKLSFDSLRKELSGIDAWILVLDTKGINVWCAAGKGTFGTDEILDKIGRTRLGEIVSARTLVLPQLGAPGVNASEVVKRSGFRVVWGPVRARDIPSFLSNGMKKDEAMRRVSFGLADRMAIAPVELAHSWPVPLAAVALALPFALPAGGGYWGRFLSLAVPLAGTAVAGTLIFPALLPLLPTRAFSVKGAVLGVAWGLAAALATGTGWLLAASLVLVSAPVVSFLGLNFTGSSTFTSQAGAKLEVDRSLVPMAVSLALGLALGVASKFLTI